MTRLVDDLLDVSRITRGKIELRRQRVELASVAGSAIEAIRPLVEKWGHQLTVTLPPEPLYLDADSTRVSQVFQNLLTNAVKYTEQGGRIWFTAELEANQVCIRVRDTGVGIPADQLRKIFDLFIQVDRSLERAQGGLGIGLTLVQRLVELHGGTVEARSDGPGKGSEFVVRLPVASAPRGVLPQRDAGSVGKEALNGAKRRILVVDDNKDAANSLAMLLNMMGYDVRTAHDGLEAVGAATTFEPSVILLDIGLPKLSGYEVARQIRQQQQPQPLLIALTGWGQEEDRRRSKAAGFDHHMTKPVDFNALKKLLSDSDPALTG
jgi:CheY-like chemotaxis protein